MLRALRRFLVVIVGLTLVVLLVWFAGPLFAFAGYQPLEPVWNRLVVIGMVIACWLGIRLVRRVRASRVTSSLLTALLKQAQPAAEQASPEAQRLRARFQDAVGALRQGRRGDDVLYGLPWYVIIGAPGSGKTTALINSGLRFPLEQKVGRGALRGVGGTRNCDWWFTEEAVLLDTAGRYTTQDSDAASDAEGWREFLALLVKYRGRRPLNGVLLTISASDLMTEGAIERERHVESARRRLAEITRELGVQLPVYVMVTKCDLVAGFAEYFEDLTHDQRSQVWGVTFPFALTARGKAAAALPDEFDALMTRLGERVFVRLEEDRDVRRRAAIFAFPQQMAALRDPLVSFVDEVFSPAAHQRPMLLRGVYFTSGTQEGTPIDRLLGSLGRRYGVNAEAIVQSSGRGKAYFVGRLLKDVIIAESGLAGMNRALETRTAAALLGVYTAIALVPVVAFLVWSWSASRNHTYLAAVAAAVDGLDTIPPATTDASLATVLSRLDAVRRVVDVAERYRDGTPWGVRWGLYQGNAVASAARDAYARELDSALVPRMATYVRGRLLLDAAPEAQYENLKAYLMLGDPTHLDTGYLREVVEFGWGASAAGDRESLTRHVRALLDAGAAMRPVALDQLLVAQARTTIRRASVARMMYERLTRRYASDTERVVRLDAVAGAGGVLRRVSGTPLSTPVPALYTKPVFREATTTVSAALVAEYAADTWVWGDAGAPSASPLDLAAQLLELYERDYVEYWDSVLADVDLVPVRTVAEMARALGALGGSSSPLRGLLTTVAEHTQLTNLPPAGPEPTEPQPGTLASAGKAVTESVAKLVSPITGALNLPSMPGAFVTAHFQPLHQFLAGDPGTAPVDQLMARLGDLNRRLQQLGPEVGLQPAISALSDPALRDAVGALQQQAAGAPQVARTVVARASEGAVNAVAGDARGELSRGYLNEVVSECRAILTGRYPFTPNASREVPITDFARLFGHRGVYDRFFAAYLAPLVDVSRSPWRWRAGAGGSQDILRQVESARRIRDLFFPIDADRPAVGFTLTFSDLNPRATRFVLEVDGTALEYPPGPSRRASLSWPGGPGAAVATFEDRNGAQQIESVQGPWAWLRLIDKLTTRRTADGGVVLEIQGSGHFVRVVVEVDSVRSPLGSRDWQRFTCG